MMVSFTAGMLVMPHETRYISWLGIRYMSAAPIGTEAGVVRAPVRRCSMFSDAHLFLNHLPTSSGSRPKQTFKLATKAKMSASMASNLTYEGAAAARGGALATLGQRDGSGGGGYVGMERRWWWLRWDGERQWLRWDGEMGVVATFGWRDGGGGGGYVGMERWGAVVVATLGWREAMATFGWRDGGGGYVGMERRWWWLRWDGEMGAVATLGWKGGGGGYVGVERWGRWWWLRWDGEMGAVVVDRGIGYVGMERWGRWLRLDNGHRASSHPQNAKSPSRPPTLSSSDENEM